MSRRRRASPSLTTCNYLISELEPAPPRALHPAPRHRSLRLLASPAAALQLLVMSSEAAAHGAASLAGASVAPLLRTLRRCGFSRLPPPATPATPATRAARALHDAYCAFALAATSTYLIQQCFFAYQERTDMGLLAKVMFLLLCHVTSIAKQVVFLLKHDRITALVNGLDDAVYNPGERRRAALLSRRARGARRLGALYAGTAALTCALWTLFPLLARLRGVAVVFAFWIPLDYNATWTKFILTLMYTHYVTTLVGVANTTMDAFIATVLGQCKTQLTILKMDFETLAERAAARARAAGERRGAAEAALLVRCVTHHLKICHTAREVQALFGGAVLLQFGVGGWILCLAAYRMVGVNAASLEFVSIVMFLMCILTELFLYCYYGNEVAVESAEVSAAAYGMRWADGGGVGRGVRRVLPLVQCCCAGAARRPLRSAALFIPLSLETFVTILRSSYTFYAMLRQTRR